MKKYIITATGTEIGKTYYLSKLLYNLALSKKKVFALKPIISGWVNDIDNNDTLQIMYNLGLDFTEENIKTISPWRFVTPVAPNLAAEIENKDLNYHEILNYCINAFDIYEKKQCEYFFIEGAGGIMSPITNNKTWLDFIKDLDIEIILVTSSYLGSITHTLTAYETIKAHKINMHNIILNINRSDGIDHKWTAKMIENFTSIKPEILYFQDQNPNLSFL